MRVFHRLGLDVELAQVLHEADALVVWKCIADEALRRESPRMYDMKCRRDPLLPRRSWRARNNPRIRHLIG